MQLLVVAAAAAATATAYSAQAAQLCSSLQGPYCSAVTGIAAVPQYVPSLTMLARAAGQGQSGSGGGNADADDSTSSTEKALRKLMDELLKLQQRGATSAGSSGGAASEKQQGAVERSRGGFRVRGTKRRNLVSFEPTGEWTSFPGAGWIAIGGYARWPPSKLDVVPNLEELEVTLVEEGSRRALERCSKLRLRRVLEGGEEVNVKRDSVAGTWSGKYACWGTRTTATLTLVAVPAAAPSAPQAHQNRRADPGNEDFSGVFQFEAEAFPLRAMTRAGCRCLETWHFLGLTVTGGRCARPKPDMESFCHIEPDTCSVGEPAGADWDFCTPSPSQHPSSQHEGSGVSSPQGDAGSGANGHDAQPLLHPGGHQPSTYQYFPRQRVAARWKGAMLYYIGRVRAVHDNGTLAIDYDDGDKEESVDVSLVIPLPENQVDEVDHAAYVAQVDDAGNFHLVNVMFL